jgi:CRISPR system Cascade subunit CasD
MASDYHTAMDVIRASGSRPPKGEAVLSTRYYLADANFLVGLQGDKALLEQIDRALQHPKWPLYLGRKSFVPGSPVWVPDGLRPDQDLEPALRAYPLTLRPGEQLPDQGVRLEIEVDYGEGERIKQDWPLSFAERSFGLRHVKAKFIPPSEITIRKEEPCTSRF